MFGHSKKPIRNQKSQQIDKSYLHVLDHPYKKLISEVRLSFVPFNFVSVFDFWVPELTILFYQFSIENIHQNYYTALLLSQKPRKLLSIVVKRNAFYPILTNTDHNGSYSLSKAWKLLFRLHPHKHVYTGKLICFGVMTGLS